MASIRENIKNGKTVSYRFTLCLERDSNGKSSALPPDKLEMLVKNPMQRVDPPNKIERPIDALTPEQTRSFFERISECEIEFRCILHLLITTGIRRGECVGLKWRDVDFVQSLLTVERCVTYTPQSGLTVGTPKTDNSSRTIPLMASTLNLLLEWRNIQSSESPSLVSADAFIFPKESEPLKPRDPNAITRRVKRFMKSNGFPDLSPHDLRHTYATATEKFAAAFNL